MALPRFELGPQAPQARILSKLYYRAVVSHEIREGFKKVVL